MKAKVIKHVTLSFLSLILGLCAIAFGAWIAMREQDQTSVYIWEGMGACWFILITASIIHWFVDPKDMVNRCDIDNPFDRYQHLMNRLGYFLLRAIGFIIMFYYIGWLVDFEHDYFWVDILGGVLLSCWLAAFNYINYNKDEK